MMFPRPSDSHCLIIAEIGSNHQGDFQTALKLVRTAAQAGVDAVKFQRRVNKALYTSAYYNRPYDSEVSFGPTYGAHREALELSLIDLASLRDEARELGVLFGCTAFDPQALDDLMVLDVDFIKIASGDLTNTPLIREATTCEKPLAVSTGGGTAGQVWEAFKAAQGAPEVCLMQCTASYPSQYHELNLKVIEQYAKTFGCSIGFSSHYSGIAMDPVAYTLGARVIERHFTLDRTMKGTDHAFSLEPQGLRKMVRDLRRTELALGDGVKQPYPSEREPLLKMSKSLVTVADLPAGHILRVEDLVARSPGGGVPPSGLGTLLGRALRWDLPAETAVMLTDVSEETRAHAT